MIPKKHRETALTVKEMLSSEGGWLPESVAPVIGGTAHGEFDPINRIYPVLKKTIKEEIYCLHVIMIDHDNSLNVWRQEGLGTRETEDIFKVWMYTFLENMEKELYK